MGNLDSFPASHVRATSEPPGERRRRPRHSPHPVRVRLRPGQRAADVHGRVARGSRGLRRAGGHPPVHRRHRRLPQRRERPHGRPVRPAPEGAGRGRRGQRTGVPGAGGPPHPGPRHHRGPQPAGPRPGRCHPHAFRRTARRVRRPGRRAGGGHPSSLRRAPRRPVGADGPVRPRRGARAPGGIPVGGGGDLVPEHPAPPASGGDQRSPGDRSARFGVPPGRPQQHGGAARPNRGGRGLG
jgi:hypothetical protein